MVIRLIEDFPRELILKGVDIDFHARSSRIIGCGIMREFYRFANKRLVSFKAHIIKCENEFSVAVTHFGYFERKINVKPDVTDFVIQTAVIYTGIVLGLRTRKSVLPFALKISDLPCHFTISRVKVKLVEHSVIFTPKIIVPRLI